MVLSSVGVGLQRTRLRALPKEGLRVLGAEDYSILFAIAEVLCPAPGPGVPGATGIDVALLADRALEGAEADVLDGMRTALKIVESALVGALAFEHGKPFTALDRDARARVLDWFRISRIALRRTIYRSFSGFVGSLYYGDPRAWPSVGYPGPPDPAALRSAYPAQLVDLASLRARAPAEGG